MSILSDELADAKYNGMSDQAAADSLNTADVEITKQFLSGSEIFNATDDAEYAALTDPQKQSWDALCAIDSIDTSSGVAKAREAELFGQGTTTRTNLLSARKSTISRAQELGIPYVEVGHVTRARTPN